MIKRANEIYNDIANYYSDIKNIDELKDLCKSNYFEVDLKKDIIDFLIHNNEIFTEYFIYKYLPNLFEDDIDISSFSFIDEYGFDSKYLKSLTKTLNVEEFLSIEYLRDQKFDKNIILALYLANSAKYEKFFEKTRKECDIVKNESATIQNIKYNYLQKKKGVTKKKKIQSFLEKEKREIGKILSTGNFDKLKEVLNYLKLLKLQEVEVNTKVIAQDFFTLKEVKQINGKYDILGRWLYKFNIESKNISIFNINNFKVQDYYYDKMIVEKNSIVFATNKQIHIYNEDEKIIKKRYFHRTKITIAYVKWKDAFVGLILGFPTLYFVVIIVNSIAKGDFKELNNPILTLLGIVLLLIFLLMMGLVFGIMVVISIFDELFKKHEVELYKCIHTDFSNENSKSKSLGVLNILIKDSMLKKYFVKNKYVIDINNNPTIIYERVKFDKKKRATINSLALKEFVINISKEVEAIKKESSKQINNTSDADQIVKINVEIKKKIENLVDFSYVLGALENLSIDELKDKLNKETFERMIKFCLSIEKEELNNYILDTSNSKKIRLSDEFLLELLNSDKCDKVLLNENIVIEESLFAIEFILRDIKKLNQTFRIFILTTLNNFYYNDKEKALIKLYTIKNLNLNTMNPFLLNKINNLINKLGKESKTIEVSKESKPNSKDIEIKE
ncbi:MAG: hypothetical protein PF638_02940 [Candidatus Delongbacteria bacterium]|jgi:hypothetical protein|nr:hypothetical protein [Candidatus Delongbacteria bacterium]